MRTASHLFVRLICRKLFDARKILQSWRRLPPSIFWGKKGLAEAETHSRMSEQPPTSSDHGAIYVHSKSRTKRLGSLVLPQEQLAAYLGAGQQSMLHSEVEVSVKPAIRCRKQIRRPYNAVCLIRIQECYLKGDRGPKWREDGLLLHRGLRPY